MDLAAAAPWYGGGMSSLDPEVAPSSPRMGRLRLAAVRLGFLAVATGMGCGLGEVVTRQLTPPIRGISWYHYDDRYGYKHRPSIDQVTTEWGERKPWRFRTNAHGFRWPEWADAPAAGVTRALVMGDSFTFGNAVEVEQTFPAVAGAALGQGGGWEVINAGVSAWGPQNALAYLETEGASIRASCLVYAFYEGNDVMDAYVHPIYELKEGKLAPRGKPPGPKGRNEKIRDLMRAIPAYDLLLEHSQLFNLTRQVFVQKAVHQVRAKEVQRGEAEHEEKPSPELFQKMLTETLATFDRLSALARERFGGFAILMIPFREAVLRGADAPMPPERTPEWVGVRSHQAVLAWAREHGVPVVDAWEKMPADPAQIRALYFPQDFHMGVAGNRFLGEALSARLPGLCPKR